MEEKKIPFHRVGSHRRVYFGDLRAYAMERDKDRRETLDRLFDKLRAKGHYESDTTGDPPANAH